MNKQMAKSAYNKKKRQKQRKLSVPPPSIYFLKTVQNSKSHKIHQAQDLRKERSKQKKKLGEGEKQSTMKGREAKGPPSADLLVCFPSRAHLSLMPKPICSPARPSEPSKRHHHHHHLKKSSTRGGGGGGQASPLMWAKNKSMGSEISEPTSPKVTCAGQIKVRPKASSCKSWQSVMEEIERIHNSKHKKKPNWVESLGFKKDIMQFLTCLRSIRFDFRCFGSFPQPADITSEDEEDEEEDEQYHENHVGVEESDGNETSRTIFSKWYMVLQENRNKGFCKEEREEKIKSYDDGSVGAPTVPPPNALLLMRCRSAPAKSWLEEKEEQEQEQEQEDDDNEDEEKDRGKEKEKVIKKLKLFMEEEKREEEAEKREKKENLVVMKYDTDCYKFSTDIAKETWVVGGIRDALSRSRSWKR